METYFYLIGLVVAIVLFLLLRSVNLWYWKINQLLSNQNEQTELLKKIYLQLGGKIEIQEQVKDTPVEAQVSAAVRAKLKPGEIIVKIKATNKFEVWKESDWEDVVKLGNTDKFEKIH